MYAVMARVGVLVCMVTPAFRPTIDDLPLPSSQQVTQPFQLVLAALDEFAVSAGKQPLVETGDEVLHRIYRVTAYHDRGLTASGVLSGVGQCAAPADIPFGSRIYIPDLDRTFIVTDRTAKRFRHNTVDLFIADRDECIQFGRSYLECIIMPPAEPVRYASPRLAATVRHHRSNFAPFTP